jgi:hypothetical protein
MEFCWFCNSKELHNKINRLFVCNFIEKLLDLRITILLNKINRL